MQLIIVPSYRHKLCIRNAVNPVESPAARIQMYRRVMVYLYVHKFVLNYLIYRDQLNSRFHGHDIFREIGLLL